MGAGFCFFFAGRNFLCLFKAVKHPYVGAPNTHSSGRPLGEDYLCDAGFDGCFSRAVIDGQRLRAQGSDSASRLPRNQRASVKDEQSHLQQRQETNGN